MYKHTYTVYILLSVLILSIQRCYSLIESGDIIISPYDHFNSLWSFSYSIGGRLSINVSIDNIYNDITNDDNATLQYIVCSDSDMKPLIEHGITLDEACSNIPFNSVNCDLTTVLNKNKLYDNMSLYISNEDTYKLYSINCNMQLWHTNIQINAINGNNEYLDNNQMYYKYIYTLNGIVYIILCIIWLYHIISYRQWNIKLQSLLLLLPIINSIICFIHSYNWNYAAVHGEFNHLFTMLTTYINVVNYIIMFTVLSMCCYGYYIIINTLTTQHKLLYITLICTIIAVCYVQSLYRDIELLLMICLYTVQLRYMFTLSINTIEYCMTQIRILDNTSLRYKRSFVYNKIIMLRNIQICVISYIALNVLTKLWTTIFAYDSITWIVVCIYEGINIGLLISLGYIIQLRPFDPMGPYMIVASKDDDDNVNNNNNNNAINNNNRYNIVQYTSLQTTQSQSQSQSQSQPIYIQPPQLSRTSASTSTSLSTSITDRIITLHRSAVLPSPTLTRITLTAFPATATTPRTASSTSVFMQQAQQHLLQHCNQVEQQHNIRQQQYIDNNTIQHNAIRLYKVWHIGRLWSPHRHRHRHRHRHIDIDIRTPLPDLDTLFMHCYNIQHDIRHVIVVYNPRSINNKNNNNINSTHTETDTETATDTATDTATETVDNLPSQPVYIGLPPSLLQTTQHNKLFYINYNDNYIYTTQPPHKYT